MTDYADATAAMLSIEAIAMWSHVPAGEQPGPDDVVEMKQGPDGRLRGRRYPPDSDVEDEYCLRGVDDPEGPATFRVRSWLVDVEGGRADSRRRLTVCWRDGAGLGWAASEDFYPAGAERLRSVTPAR
jgi:hypothetical protein